MCLFAGVVGFAGVLGIAGCGRQAQPLPMYMPKSEFWQALPANAAVDPGSPGFINDLRKGTTQGQLSIATTAYNVPIVRPAQGTAKVAVSLTTPGPTPLCLVPIPDSARPAQGTDGDLVIVDESIHTAYEFFQMRHNGTAWQATAGLAFDTQGDGINHAGTGIRATSLSLLLGLLTYDEITGGGPIQHALAWTADRGNSQYFTSPATSSDGAQMIDGAASIPEGARLQLDPGLDVSRLGLSPTGQRIAEALQHYGMFLLDLSSDSSLVAESLDGTGRSWDGVLAYDEVQNIPAGSFRVLKLKDQLPIPH